MRNLVSILSNYKAGRNAIIKQPTTLHIDRQRYLTLAKATRYPYRTISQLPYPNLEALHNLWTTALCDDTPICTRYF